MTHVHKDKRLCILGECKSSQHLLKNELETSIYT